MNTKQTSQARQALSIIVTAYLSISLTACQDKSNLYANLSNTDFEQTPPASTPAILEESPEDSTWNYSSSASSDIPAVSEYLNNQILHTGPTLDHIKEEDKQSLDCLLQDVDGKECI